MFREMTAAIVELGRQLVWPSHRQLEKSVIGFGLNMKAEGAREGGYPPKESGNAWLLKTRVGLSMVAELGAIGS